MAQSLQPIQTNIDTKKEEMIDVSFEKRLKKSIEKNTKPSDTRILT